MLCFGLEGGAGGRDVQELLKSFCDSFLMLIVSTGVLIYPLLVSIRNLVLSDTIQQCCDYKVLGI